MGRAGRGQGGTEKGGERAETGEAHQDRDQHAEEMQEHRQKSPKRWGRGKQGGEQRTEHKAACMHLRSRLLPLSPARMHRHRGGDPTPTHRRSSALAAPGAIDRRRQRAEKRRRGQEGGRAGGEQRNRRGKVEKRAEGRQGKGKKKDSDRHAEERQERRR